MTERQAQSWPGAVDKIRGYGIEASYDLTHYDWSIRWDEESRPGRGHSFYAIWLDGENIATVWMDVYGYPTVAVGSTEWVHNDSDEECTCDPCQKRRESEWRAETGIGA